MDNYYVFKKAEQLVCMILGRCWKVLGTGLLEELGEVRSKGEARPICSGLLWRNFRFLTNKPIAMNILVRISIKISKI